MHDEIHADVKALRRPDHAVDPAFINRWSPRAFAAREVAEETLLSLFEAARWAASSNNEQPWRFVLARSEADRARFVGVLMPGNQTWAALAPVLVLVCSKKTFTHNGVPNRTYQFDAGAASAYMALAATLNGLIAHGMAGLDQNAAREVFEIPDDFEPIAAFAIGHHGNVALLPAELAAREKPSGRRPIAESIMEGRFLPTAEVAAERDTVPNPNAARLVAPASP